MPTPSMDDKDTPSPPTRQVWQFEADKLLGHNAPPWPSDDERRAALISAGLAHWLPEEALMTTRAKRKMNPHKGTHRHERVASKELIHAKHDTKAGQSDGSRRARQQQPRHPEERRR